MGLSPGDRVEMTIVASVSGGSFGTSQGRLGYIRDGEWCWERPVLEYDRPRDGDTVEAEVIAIDPGTFLVCQTHQHLRGSRVKFAASIRAVRSPKPSVLVCNGCTESASERGIGPLTPVTDLGLSVRARNIFRLNGIRNLSDLLKRSEDELLDFRGFGGNTLIEVWGVLTELDMHLRGDSPDRIRVWLDEGIHGWSCNFPSMPPES